MMAFQAQTMFCIATHLVGCLVHAKPSQTTRYADIGVRHIVASPVTKDPL